MTAYEDVLIAWVAMGMTRKEMAGTLHRSPKTVEGKLAKVKLKLGFNDPARLTHFALSHKLLKLNETV